MSDHEYIPKSKAAKWFNDRLPLLTLGAHLTDYPTPKKFKLLVDFRWYSDFLFNNTDCYRNSSCNALCCTCRFSIRQC